MHTFIKNQIPSIFSDLIKRPDNKYPTNFSQSSFYLKRYSLNSTKYSISIRGLKLWNDVINNFFRKKDYQFYFTKGTLMMFLACSKHQKMQISFLSFKHQA